MPTDALRTRLANRLLRDEALSRYTVARLGGPADWLYVAQESIEELAEVVAEAWTHDIPVRIIGGGANVLVSDKGIRGLVIINHISEIKTGNWPDGRVISATAGTSLTVFSRKCQSYGLTGMEWAVNIPGTVGGAIINNAGAHNGSIAASLADVVALEADGAKLYSNEDLQFDYRHSVLKSRADRQYLVLLATFILSPDEPDKIKARMSDFTAHRKRTQPAGASLGSIFKNPPGDYAGRLIEESGLKDYRIGNAMVSPVHANFLINVTDGNKTATATDYKALIEHVQETVYSKDGIKLEMEIEIIGDWD